jgi:guanylate kinase
MLSTESVYIIRLDRKLKTFNSIKKEYSETSTIYLLPPRHMRTKGDLSRIKKTHLKHIASFLATQPTIEQAQDLGYSCIPHNGDTYFDNAGREAKLERIIK